MNSRFLDQVQRRLYKIDRKIESIKDSMGVAGSEYGDPRTGYRLAYDDIEILEVEAQGLIKQLRSNI